jgi:hypothetical protein
MAIPLKYNLRNLRVRWVTSLLTVAGITLVTVVFVMMFAMGLGHRAGRSSARRPAST